MVNHIGIDVETHGKAKLIRALSKLKSTVSVEDGGQYWQDPAYSVIRLSTTMTQQQVEDWAYRVKVGDAVYGTWVQQ